MLGNKSPRLINGLRFCSFTIDKGGKLLYFGLDDIKCEKLRKIDSRSDLKKGNNIEGLPEIQCVDCMESSAVCIGCDGKIYSLNRIESLINGKTLFQINPMNHEKIIMDNVNCGIDFTIERSIDGKLYSFGENNCGQLGIGNTEKNSIINLVEIPQGDIVDFFVCSIKHTICKIARTNELYVWREIMYEDVVIIFTNKYVPNEIRNIENIANINYPFNIKCSNINHSHIIDIKSNDYGTMIHTLNGNVYICGDGYKSLRGNGCFPHNNIQTPDRIKRVPKIKSIECGKEHMMLIDIHNSLWTFGNNYRLQCGIFKFWSNIITGSIKISSLEGIVCDVSCGGDYTLVMTLNREIYALRSYDSKYLFGISREINGKKAESFRVFEGNENVWEPRILPNCRQKSARK